MMRSLDQTMINNIGHVLWVAYVSAVYEINVSGPLNVLFTELSYKEALLQRATKKLCIASRPASVGDLGQDTLVGQHATITNFVLGSSHMLQSLLAWRATGLSIDPAQFIRGKHGYVGVTGSSRRRETTTTEFDTFQAPRFLVAVCLLTLQFLHFVCLRPVE